MVVGAKSNGETGNLELQNWNLPKAKGDKWQQVDSDKQPVENWVYNGFFWVGKTREQHFNFVDLSNTAPIIISVEKDFDLLIKTLEIDYSIIGKNQSGKNWNLNLYQVDNNLGRSLVNSQSTIGSNYASLRISINLQDLLALNQTLFYQLEAQKVGSTGTLSISGKLIYSYWRN